MTALFEPAHGTAPHRTGTRRANPTGAWLCLAALFDWCPDLRPLGVAARIRDALEKVYASGARTYDLGGAVGLDEFNHRILEALT